MVGVFDSYFSLFVIILIPVCFVFGWILGRVGRWRCMEVKMHGGRLWCLRGGRLSVHAHTHTRTLAHSHISALGLEACPVICYLY